MVSRRPQHPVAPSLPPVSHAPGDVSLDQVEAILHDLVAGMAPDPVPARGRPRILPALALWSGLLVGILRGSSAIAGTWRLLSGAGLWWFPRFPISDQAVAKRIADDDGATIRTMFTAISSLLATRLAPLLPSLTPLVPWASCVVALDESTLDGVARRLPALRALPAGDRRLLPGKLACAFDLRAQQFLHVDHLPDPCQRETVHARALLQALPPGSLVIADMGYVSYAWFDHVVGTGHHWLSRCRARTSTVTRQVLYASGDGSVSDRIVWLGAHKSTRASHPVRLVEFRTGGTTRAFLTSVLDPAKLSVRDIAVAYARRWDIEMAFDLLKRHLNLHMVWSPRPALVVAQVYATLAVAQVVQALRMEVAIRAGADPFEVSIPLLMEMIPMLARQGDPPPLASLVERGRALGVIRPSRRVTIEVPDVPDGAYTPLDPVATTTREPRYQRAIDAIRAM